MFFHEYCHSKKSLFTLLYLMFPFHRNSIVTIADILLANEKKTQTVIFLMILPQIVWFGPDCCKCSGSAYAATMQRIL